MNAVVIGQITPETVEELKRRKLIRDEQEQAVELALVGPGEEIIGNLTFEERAIYTEIVTVTSEIETREKELTARSLDLLADAIRKSDKPEQIRQNYSNSALFMSDTDAEEFFALHARLNYLRATFEVSVRERYGYGSTIGVRTGFTVVRTGYKYSRPDNVG